MSQMSDRLGERIVVEGSNYGTRFERDNYEVIEVEGSGPMLAPRPRRRRIVWGPFTKLRGRASLLTEWPKEVTCL